MDWQIKTFKDKWMPRKQKMIVQSILTVIKRYDVSAIALKIPYRVEKTTNLSALLRAIQTALSKQGIPILQYTLNELKKTSGDNKQLMMAQIVKKYPCLYSLYQKERSNRNHYYLKIFEALLVADHCQQQLKDNIK